MKPDVIDSFKVDHLLTLKPQNRTDKPSSHNMSFFNDQCQLKSFMKTIKVLTLEENPSVSLFLLPQVSIYFKKIFLPSGNL